MNATEAMLQPVQLAHGVLLCAVMDRQLVIGEIAGDKGIFGDILDYADDVGCTAVLFNTARKAVLFAALAAANARHQWQAPQITGYFVEMRREE